MNADSQPPNPDRQFIQQGWITVAILWVVAMLSYLDRLIIVSMRESVVASIPMTEAQFGLLTAIFLWVYGILSPFGGFLADRLGRKWIIFFSLLIWSVLTWWTGHVHSLEQMIWARALMGVSEACYIPAALALITDYHRGRTRSLATGLHGSGIYVGIILGGVGGYLAEYVGWRAGFTFFGILGITYSMVVLFFLREAKPVGSGSAIPTAPIRLGQASKSLLSHGSFYALVGLSVVMSLANWLVYGWLPTYLQEGFGLGQGAAGLSATSYIQVASLVGILVGGLWADRWSSSNPRGRALVTAIGLTAAAPALFLTGGTTLLAIAIASLILFGFGRGFYDANLMPIMRQHIDERYTATGYGILNFIGCMVGGLMTYAGGALRDAHIPLGILFQGAAVGLAMGGVILFCLRPSRRGHEATQIEN